MADQDNTFSAQDPQNQQDGGFASSWNFGTSGDQSGNQTSQQQSSNQNQPSNQQGNQNPVPPNPPSAGSQSFPPSPPVDQTNGFGNPTSAQPNPPSPPPSQGFPPSPPVDQPNGFGGPAPAQPFNQPVNPPPNQFGAPQAPSGQNVAYGQGSPFGQNPPPNQFGGPAPGAPFGQNPPYGQGSNPFGGPTPPPPFGAPPREEDNTPANFQIGTKLPKVISIKLPPHTLQVDEQYFLHLLAGSISLTKDEKKRIIESIPKLKQSQVDELIRIFEEERKKFAELSAKHVEQLKKLDQQHFMEWQSLELDYKASERKGRDDAQADEIRKKLGLG